MAVHIPRVQCRPMPDDFPHVAPTMSMTELRGHYHCGTGTVNRWCHESGVDYRGRKKPGEAVRKPRKYQVVENHEVIDTCLFCPYPANICRGHCDRLAQVKAELMEERGDSRSKYTSAQKAWMIARRAEGYKMAEIARFTGINSNTVARCCSGAPPRPKCGTLPPLESRREEWDALC